MTTPLYLVVTAHPDDESMFFLPTLVQLSEEQNDVALLCLTTGNYDGLGIIRTRELHEACRLLNISESHVDDVLQDDPTKHWSDQVVAERIQWYLENKFLVERNKKRQIVIITFDEGGVSGHVNHVHVFRGVCQFIRQNNKQFNVQAFQLDTITNSLLKYFALGDIVVALLQPCINKLLTRKYSKSPDNNTDPFTLTSQNKQQHHVVIYRLFQPWLVWKAMAMHHSQFVWYRKLSVLFSRYTYTNTLRPLQMEESTADEHDKKHT